MSIALRRVVVLLVVAASFLAITEDVAADHMASTSWICTATEKIKVPTAPKQTRETSDISISLDADQNFTLVHPDWGTYHGTVTDKGEFGFRAEPDQTAVDTYRDFLAQVAQDALGADSVTVTRVGFKVAGKVTPDGQTLRFKTKSFIKGSAVISGRVRRGKVRSIATFVGTPAP